MDINFDSYHNKEPLFDREIDNAISWLFKVMDSNKVGWGWIPHIPPNEQNTAEVICSLIDNQSVLTDIHKSKISLAIKNWLINPSRNATITIDWAWVLKALQKVEINLNGLLENISIDEINSSKTACIEWLVGNQNPNGGWADIKNDISSVSRTALTFIALAKEDRTSNSNLKIILEKAIKWLVKSQNSDGGWGNVRRDNLEGQLANGLDDVPYTSIECQYLSNPACTGYAILALNAHNIHKYRRIIEKGIYFIENSQLENGSWTVFSEVGLRKNEKFTFRHFSTTWALLALLESKFRNYSSESVLNGIEYLLSLQDKLYGGWKSSPDSDSYTWSTSNALEILSKVHRDLKKIKAQNFLCIVKEWWKLKLDKSTFTWKFGKHVFAFNQTFGMLFCITYTLLLLSWNIFLIILTDKLFHNFNNHILLIIKAIECFLIALMIGIPWVILIKYTFKNEIEGWLSSIAWVYGIITGILIAFYSFLIT